MSKINEATDTDLTVIEQLQQFGWKRGDTLLYQQEYAISIICDGWNRIMIVVHSFARKPKKA
ncbi:MAG TPA: hypothetical protein ACFYEK_09865 [Candidatus Wunengus sp. YC60]|uniref:hypothetical protein n=1 Tax=Candidatus Wunengus sp. YC60 TaxID=3367697 RepID=UPI0040268929